MNTYELYPTLFLLATIPLLWTVIQWRKKENTVGRQLLNIGFVLVTIVAVYHLSRSLNVFAFSYSPYMDQYYQMGFLEERPAWWHKLGYWIVRMLKFTGFVMIGIGSLLESRLIYHRERTKHQPAHLPETPSSQEL